MSAAIQVLWTLYALNESMHPSGGFPRNQGVLKCSGLEISSLMVMFSLRMTYLQHVRWPVMWHGWNVLLYLLSMTVKYPYVCSTSRHLRCTKTTWCMHEQLVESFEMAKITRVKRQPEATLHETCSVHAWTMSTVIRDGKDYTREKSARGFEMYPDEKHEQGLFCWETWWLNANLHLKAYCVCHACIRMMPVCRTAEYCATTALSAYKMHAWWVWYVKAWYM
jgi:hypothetical protein